MQLSELTPERRLATIGGLGRAFLVTGTDLQQVLEQLAIALTASLCDGCSILLTPASGVSLAVTRRKTGSPDEAIAGTDRVHAMPFPRSDLVHGTVAVTRNRGSAPFDSDDLETVTACVEYASLAIESALRFEADRLCQARSGHFQKQVLGIVGHDLRAPLGSIVVGTELLEMDVKDDPGAMSVLKRIDTSVVRMRRMIDQLLDLTRARLGDGIPISRTKTQLLPLVTSVIGELAMTQSTTKLEVVGADITGVWDPDRLGQAISNVLTNALQYGREGAPIVIELDTIEGAATITVHNTIRDEPIPPDVLARLFEPDRRGVHDVRHSKSGLGLGLYIAAEIIRAHGGSITAV
ncbi:MAG: HAMP domain-containing histidine kinase, partial [Deltaproteobacteria bacterium]|nr:HAMP domain-containing histidine kinase [Deltaproteobacteria bacterium]